jgi:hypothetical protein
MTAGRPRQIERAMAVLKERLPAIDKQGGRLPPVRILSAELGISVPTLRAAQLRLAKERLLEIRHGSGVYLTERARTKWIGIYTAFDILQPRTSSFHTLVPYALRNYFKTQGFIPELYLGQSMPGDLEQGPSSQRFVGDVANGRLAGVVIQNAPETSGWLQYIEELSIPAVGSNTAYHVDSGYVEMVGQAVRHLHRQGCRRIAMLSYAPEAGRDELEKALARVHLPLHTEWIRHDLHPMLSGAGWEEFREIWMARREKPDGLLVTDDVLFDEARVAIQELGIRVPEQLRIVTHANKGAVRRYPFPVTEVQFDPERYATLIGCMMMKRLRGEAVKPASQIMSLDMVETVPVAAAVSPRVVPHEAGR